MTAFENLFSVERLRCGACRRHIPHVVFEGDTDMATAGLGALTALSRPEVVLARLTGPEWNLGEVGTALFQARIARQLDRADLVIPTVKRRERREVRRRVAAFGPPPVETLTVYQCPCCPEGEAIAVDTVRPARFEAEGGRITVAPPPPAATPVHAPPAALTASPAADDWTARQTLFAAGRRYRVLEACQGWWDEPLVAGEVLRFERFAYSRYDGCHVYVFQAAGELKAWRLGDDDPVLNATRHFAQLAD